MIAFDTETFLIGPDAVAPKLVCLSYAHPLDTGLIHAKDDWRADFRGWLASGEVLVAHNLAFDLSVLCTEDPSLVPAIMDKFDRGQFECTVIREKLGNLGTRGIVDFVVAPDGSEKRISYSLATLMKNRFGVDRFSEKEDEDSWRLNYHRLYDKDIADWPEEAKTYAINDAKDVVRVYEAQEAEYGGMVAPTSCFQAGLDFVLRMMTCHGIFIDQGRVSFLKGQLAEELSEERMAPLVQLGIVTKSTPARPHARGAREHAPECNRKGCECPPKMVVAKPGGKVSKKALEEYVLGNFPPSILSYTEPSGKFPEGQLRTDKGWLKAVHGQDPIIDLYEHRQSLQKLVTTELPTLEAHYIYPNYSVLKKTGRTGSHGGKLYPSRNIQQPHPKTRPCYRAREGHVWVSVDLDFLELCCSANKCLELFGYSQLAEDINSGKDPHASLGAVLAANLDHHFGSSVAGASKDSVYAAFLKCKTDPDADVRKFFKHYRTFAKPTGLGYPGGLGPATFVDYAFKTYGVEVTEDQAVRMRELWFETRPEMKPFFKWVEQACKNPATGQFDYVTSMGMRRAGCSFTAAANGSGMQSDSAEGVKLALYQIWRSCVDPTQDSILLGCRPLVFMHDEVIVEVPVTEPQLMDAQATEVARILKLGVSQVITRVKIGAAPVMMINWDKSAEAVYDEDGYLTVWTP